MRDFRLLLLSVVIACLVWLMHTFALTYSANMPCTVQVTTSLQGYAAEAVAAACAWASCLRLASVMALA